MSDNKTTVLLVDDHELVRAGFRRLLEDGDKLVVVAEAGSGEQAVQDYVKHHPDVVVMDRMVYLPRAPYKQGPKVLYLNVVRQRK